MATAFILHSNQIDQWCSAKKDSEAAMSDISLRQGQGASGLRK